MICSAQKLFVCVIILILSDPTLGLKLVAGRRAFIAKATNSVGLVGLATSQLAAPASAGIDPAALAGFKVDGDVTGTATRLNEIKSVVNPVTDQQDIPFMKLDSGVSYREFREGRGEAKIGKGSKIGAEMTIRIKAFSTNNEPGGVKYYETQKDTDFNEIAWTVGAGELFPELEEGMMGMKKGALRRIEVPSMAVFAAKKASQLPVPLDKNKDEKRRFDALFKTDATLLFEVLITRVKNPPAAALVDAVITE
ncbi:hypothetical protein TrLO_g2791 [Triparma laevis f. longispina]|uniref:peptidylprolyl isomerase n=1 Tax=Triparma laevis f. longispina TaxID=1714387 RepID=A0A9W7FUD1_9STRA|nr:hypothetical protein TrLO_g2791 [Triparma laevis f. longispina]